MMEILVCNGFSPNNYGAWLNQIMETSPSEWVMFHDHDVFLPNLLWYKVLEENIRNAENPGLLTCVTNRIGNGQQKVGPVADHDMGTHIKRATELLDIKPKLVDVTDGKPISGVIMVTSKTAWKAAGGFRDKGMYVGLDNNYHGRIKRAGYKVYIMRNFYVYHRYRFNPGEDKK